GPASSAPRHRAVSRVEPATLVALLEKVPVVLDVEIRHREVRAWPVHPLPQLSGLLRLDTGEVEHALATGAGEALEAERPDLALRVEPQRLLDLDLHPQPLAVEPVLEPLIVAAHRLVALDHVLRGRSEE